MFDVTDRKQLRAWLSDQPSEVSVAIAARAALRVLPLIWIAEQRFTGDFGAAIVLPIFRSTAVAWIAARFPTRTTKEILAAAALPETFDFIPFSPLRAARYAVSAAEASYDIGDFSAPDAAVWAVDAAEQAAESADVAIDALVNPDDVIYLSATALAADVEALQVGMRTATFAVRELWPKGPVAVSKYWSDLKRCLLAREGEDWAVWTEWYDARLEGRRANETLEIARATIADYVWRQGPAVLNSKIRQLIDALDSPPEIPSQHRGPHFEIGEDGRVGFAPPADLDHHGNNVARLTKLHPHLLSLAAASAQALSLGNSPHANLRDRLNGYRAQIDRALGEIDFGTLYVEGVRLANAEKTALAERDLPPLDAKAREEVSSLLDLHGTFMLATTEGQESIAAEERYRRTVEEDIAYRKAAIAFAEGLQNQPRLIKPDAAELVIGAAQQIGEGANHQRSGVVASGVIGNVAITLGAAATLSALTTVAIATKSPELMVSAGATTLIGYEGLKKSRPFAVVAGLVTKGLNKVSEAELSVALDALAAHLRPHCLGRRAKSAAPRRPAARIRLAFQDTRLDRVGVSGRGRPAAGAGKDRRNRRPGMMGRPFPKAGLKSVEPISRPIEQARANRRPSENHAPAKSGAADKSVCTFVSGDMGLSTSASATSVRFCVCLRRHRSFRTSAASDFPGTCRPLQLKRGRTRVSPRPRFRAARRDPG